MQLVWTPSGGSPVTLGDDAATPRKTIALDGFAGAALVQNEPLMRGANPFQKARANVAGAFSFTITQSCSDLDAVATLLVAEYGRLGEQGDLQWSRGSVISTFDDAILTSIEKVAIDGKRVDLRYSFTISVIS